MVDNSTIFDIRSELSNTHAARAKQREEYERAVSQEMRTQDALRSAMTELSDVSKPNASLFQIKQGDPEKKDSKAGPPKPKLAAKKRRTSEEIVMQTLNMLLEDSVRMEAQLKDGEKRAQAAYEETLRDTRAGLNAHESDLEDLEYRESDLIKRQTDIRTEIADLEQKVAEAEGLSKAVQERCGKVVDGFNKRQDARSDEISRLKEAQRLFDVKKLLGLN